MAKRVVRKTKKRVKIRWGRLMVLLLPLMGTYGIIDALVSGINLQGEQKVIEQRSIEVEALEPIEEEVKEEETKQKPVVVIDAGKGGSNNGVTKNGIKEKDINLLIANKLIMKLSDYGVTVVMTRESDTDVSIDERLLKNKGANLMLSLHCNYVVDDSVKGIETYYYNNTENTDVTRESEKLASTLQKYMMSWVSTEDRGVRLTNLELLKKSDIPTAMVQLGFISNVEEATNLQNNEYQKMLVDSIAEGIINYLNYY